MSASLEILIAVWQAAPPERREAMIEAGQGTATNASDAAPTVSRALTFPKAAEKSGFSVMTLRREMEAKRLRIVRPYGRGKPRILEADLIRWIEGGAA